MSRCFIFAMRVLAFGMLLAIAGAAAAQQTYPNKPIRLISPNPPGGSTTLWGRLIGQKLTEAWGQQVILDNRGGGNGLIGGDAVAKAAPDGYTLEQVSSTHLITPLLIPAPYDPIKDFAPVATYVRNETILVAYPGVSAKNLQELIALAKSKPGELNYASSGGGSPLHLAGVLFEEVTGVKIQHIPYKGGGPAVTDLIGGQVQLSFQTPVAVMSHVKSGRLKALAITGDKRSVNLPQVPTFAEAGLPAFYALAGAQGILAPAGTPADIINKLANEIARIAATPDFIEKVIAQGAIPHYSNPAQMAEMMKADTAKFARLIKLGNIQID